MFYNKQLAKALKEKQDINSNVELLVLSNEEGITRIIARRWKRGEGVNGGIIGEYQNQNYKMFKVQKNSLANGNVDLILTGSLNENLTIAKKGNDFEIFSTDKKYKKIGEKYGFENFNLSPDENKKLIAEIYYKVMEEYFNNVYKIV